MNKIIGYSLLLEHSGPMSEASVFPTVASKIINLQG